MVLVARDRTGFLWVLLGATWKVIAVSCVRRTLYFSVIKFKSLSDFLAGILGVVVRKTIAEYLQNLYASGTQFYRLNVLHKTVDNP